MPPEPDAAAELRVRILAGAARCIERWSVSKATLSDVAAEAGVSRATLYRRLAELDLGKA